jgi:hypothetical protein
MAELFHAGQSLSAGLRDGLRFATIEQVETSYGKHGVSIEFFSIPRV